MRLKPLQWLWVGGVAAMVGGLALDILDVIDPANLVWLAASGLLLLTAPVMPGPAWRRKVRRHG